MSDRDCKFVVHHPEMVKQKKGAREKRAGREVILVQRILKNTVSEKVGSRAYALYSDACIHFLLWGPHVRFRRVQTLVREGSPLVKLRNSA